MNDDEWCITVYTFVNGAIKYGRDSIILYILTFKKQ